MSIGWLVAVALAAAPALAADLDPDAALRTSQAAIGRALPDVALRDSGGKPVTMSQLLGKPLVVSMIYTSCPGVCPLTTEALTDAVEIAEEALGPDAFRVVTIGFDSRHDTPDRMRAYSRRHGRDRDLFLSGDDAVVGAIAEATGFTFVPTAWGFDHPSQVTLIAADGRVAAQVYGADFTPPFLVEPLKRLVFGRDLALTSLGLAIDRVKFLCTVYDPATGRYRFDYSPILAFAGGVLSLGLMVVVGVREWRRGGSSRVV